MLGFGKWQLLLAAFALVGLVLAVAGAFTQSMPMSVIGFATAITAGVTIQLLLGRHATRRTQVIRLAVRRLEKKMDDQSRGRPPLTSDTEAPRHVQGVGPEYELMNRMPSLAPHLETFALRSRSLGIRDAFARAASDGKFGHEDLMRIVAVHFIAKLDTDRTALVKSFTPKLLLTLARLAANQRLVDTDIQDALRLFTLVEKTQGTQSLGKVDRFLFLEMLGEAGSSKLLREAMRRFGTEKYFPTQATLLKLNSSKSISGHSEEAWLDRLNALFGLHDLVAVELSKGTDAAIDRLQAPAQLAVVEGPTVSVVMPTFNGSALITTAVNSLLAQTWKNLEIIIVDDCSDGSHHQLLKRLENQDSRVRVIFQEENQGPYVARNRGVDEAAGEFLTVHDDDDWSHPQKIELQVRHLINNPGLPANLTNHARCTDELSFLRINNNPQFTQPNFSSLMVRKSIFKEVGKWDLVNRGGDAEFRDRVASYFDIKIPVVGSVPLSFTRTRPGSLTAGEMTRGYVEPSRLLYLASYQRWHNTTRRFAGQPFLTSAIERPFARPESMKPGMRGRNLGNFDVVFATDFRFPGGTSSLTLTEIETSISAGRKVGVIHLESPLNKSTAPISDRFFQIVEELHVPVISLSDSAEIELLVVRHPSVAQFLDQASTQLTVRQVVLIVNNPPVLSGGDGMIFDINQCLRNLDMLFGGQTEVAPESEVIARYCRELVARSRLACETWPGFVKENTNPIRVPNGQPTVGRHSRDHALKWPSRRDEFIAAYAGGQAFSTVILGGAESLKAKLGEDVLDGLSVHPFGSMDVTSFLAHIDFWVYFHDDHLTESFGMATAEAMAAGKVVILPLYMEATFGQGAVYGTPLDVPNIVARYSRDPEAYREQALRARQVIAERYSETAYNHRIDRFRAVNGSLVHRKVDVA